MTDRYLRLLTSPLRDRPGPRPTADRRTRARIFLACFPIALAALVTLTARPAAAAEPTAEGPADSARPLRVNLVNGGISTRELNSRLRQSGVEVHTFVPDAPPRGEQAEAPSIWTGYSATAHNALITAALEESVRRVDGLVLFAPPLLPHNRTGYKSHLWKRLAHKDPGLFRRDPDYYLRDVRIPTLVVHGTFDHMISPFYVERFAREQTNTGVQALFVAEAGHGVFNMTPQQWRYVKKAAAALIVDLAHGRSPKLDPDHRVIVVTRPDREGQFRPVLSRPKVYEGRFARPKVEGKEQTFWEPGSVKREQARRPVRVVTWH